MYQKNPKRNKQKRNNTSKQLAPKTAPGQVSHPSTNAPSSTVAPDARLPHHVPVKTWVRARGGAVRHVVWWDSVEDEGPRR